MHIPMEHVVEHFAKLAEVDLMQFQTLGKKNLFNKVETLLTPKLKQEDPDLAARAQAATEAERDYFRKRYNVTARLTGSMPLQLGVPGDVDLDFYSRIKSPNKFNQVVARLENNPDYVGSKYNKPGAAFQVFQRQAKGKDDFPVDFAIAYGQEADRLSDQLKKKEQAASELPPGVKRKLVEKKMMLKHTPFDIKAKRYKAWKRDLDKALGGGEVIRLQRKPHPDLVAAMEKAASGFNPPPIESLMQPSEWQADPEKRKWLFHGAPQDVHDPIHDEGLVVKQTAKHNMGRDESGVIGHEGLQARSVHLTPDPLYAMTYGLHDRKGELGRSNIPNIYAVPYDPDKMVEKNPELSMAFGTPVFSRAYLHEGDILREDIRKVIFPAEKNEAGRNVNILSSTPEKFVPLDDVVKARIRKGTRQDPLPEKTAAIVDLTDPESLKKFRSFTQRKDVYGHRTPHIESVLEGGKIISSLDALKQGKLKSFEGGVGAGARRELKSSGLSDDRLDELSSAVLKAKPDTSAFKSVAKDVGLSPQEVKATFLRQRFGDVKKFLHSGEVDGEAFRKKHLGITKLSPNIFLTKGGLMDEPGYGDVGVLVRNRTAERSPFLNLLTDEHIVGQKDVLEPRRISVEKGLVIGPKERVQSLNKKFPKYQYVVEEDIPDNVKKTMYRPTRSIKEITGRILPNIMEARQGYRPI